MSEGRPRVLMLATRVPLASGDGTPSFVLDHAVALADRFEIVIVAPRMAGSPRTVEHDGVTVHRFAYFPSRWERLADDAIMPQLGRDPLLWLQAALLVAAMLVAAIVEHRRLRPDVVHAHWILPGGLVALVLRTIFRTPYLVTSHGADAFLFSSRLLEGIKRVVIRRGHRLIGVSHEIARRLPSSGTPVEVQPVAVDLDGWRDLATPRDPEPGRVLFIGRLAEKKGVLDALQAVGRTEGVRLRVAGDGPLLSELWKATESMDPARVTILGRLTRDQVGDELRRAMCVVLPSTTAADGDRDGTPSVLAEAIAAEVPIVASRIAGIGELIADGETGLLHDPGDVDALAACLERLTRDPELGHRIAERAHREISSVFDHRRVSDRYASWFKAAMFDRVGGTDAI